MNDVDVLRLAVGVLQRKAETIIKGCLGRQFDKDIAVALVSSGRLSVLVDLLEEVAEHLERAKGVQNER